MIQCEFYKEVSVGRLFKTYSDSGMMIRQDGTGDLYVDAIDPEDMGRTYIETEISVEEWEAMNAGTEEETLPGEVMEDAEPEDPDGPLPIPEELVR